MKQGGSEQRDTHAKQTDAGDNERHLRNRFRRGEDDSGAARDPDGYHNRHRERQDDNCEEMTRELQDSRHAMHRPVS